MHDILSTGKNMRHEKKLVFDFVLVVRGYLAGQLSAAAPFRGRIAGYGRDQTGV